MFVIYTDFDFIKAIQDIQLRNSDAKETFSLRKYLSQLLEILSQKISDKPFC